MPWTPDNDAIKQVIDANIRTSDPNQNGINTPETVKQLFNLYWEEVKGQVSTAVENVDETSVHNNSVGF